MDVSRFGCFPIAKIDQYVRSRCNIAVGGNVEMLVSGRIQKNIRFQAYAKYVIIMMKERGSVECIRCLSRPSKFTRHRAQPKRSIF